MKQWDKIFQKNGKIFFKVDQELIRIVGVFKKNKIKKILDLLTFPNYLE